MQVDQQRRVERGDENEREKKSREEKNIFNYHYAKDLATKKNDKCVIQKLLTVFVFCFYWYIVVLVVVFVVRVKILHKEKQRVDRNR